MDDLDKRRDQRARFLCRVYDATEAGHPMKGAVVREIGAEMGLDPGESDAVAHHLVGRKLIRWNTLAGDVVMTPEGVAEAERLKDREKQQPVPQIPASVIAEVARAFSDEYTHAQIDNLFMSAGAPGDPPVGSKLVKVGAWLRLINADPDVDALAVLGKLLEEFMEMRPPPYTETHNDALAIWEQRRSRIGGALADRGLSYQMGGKILGGALSAPSKALADLIRARDLPAIHAEFERALENVESDPPSAVTAACAILESACRTYIADEGLALPGDQSIHPLWKVVQAHLGLAPSTVQSDDLKRMLGGLASIVDGVGAFRTHAGSAHGRDAKAVPIEPRHARLAVHAAHTVVTFLLESWKRSKP